MRADVHLSLLNQKPAVTSQISVGLHDDVNPSPLLPEKKAPYIESQLALSLLI